MHPLRFLVPVLSLAAALAIAEPLKTPSTLALNNAQRAADQPNVEYYAYVVEDEGFCSYFGTAMPMCGRKNFVCRMKPGEEAYSTEPSCLAYNTSNMEDNPYETEEKSIAPWETCTLTAELNWKIGAPPVCQRDFKCKCLQGVGGSCICAPADIVDDVHGALTCNGGTTTCPWNEYCHYLEKGGKECGKKPYFL
uniref:Uncharacterized protein n=1 Tax=Peronospora matthiolae TaxID=2874970 RepID=A0AAV1UI81_9STRA